MTQSDLLKPLVDAIETVKQRIQEHGASLRGNETRTRVVLIDPILNALGWDVSDPRLVTLENPTEPGRVDYALLAEDAERPRVLIEAKRLGTNLESHRSQMVNYAVTQGILYAGLTDGNIWELYEVFKPTALSEKKLLDIEINTASSSAEKALSMLLLWRANVESGQPKPAGRPIQGTPENGSSTGQKEGRQIVRPTQGIALSAYNMDLHGKPQQVFFPKEEPIEIKNNADLLRETAKWLYRQERFSVTPLPILSSVFGAALINNRPQDPDGTPFRSHYQIPGEQIYLRMHANAKLKMTWAKRIVEECGLEPSEVILLPVHSNHN